MNDITIKDLCELTGHITRAAQRIIENAELKANVADEDIYEDIARQVMRESGSYNLETADKKYLYEMHEAIDSYVVPACMLEKEAQKDGS